MTFLADDTCGTEEGDDSSGDECEWFTVESGTYTCETLEAVGYSCSELSHPAVLGYQGVTCSGCACNLDGTCHMRDPAKSGAAVRCVLHRLSGTVSDRRDQRRRSPDLETSKRDGPKHESSEPRVSPRRRTSLRSASGRPSGKVATAMSGATRATPSNSGGSATAPAARAVTPRRAKSTRTTALR